MKDTGDMDALLRQLSSSGVPVESPDRAAERRERVVSKLANFHVEVLGRRERRERLRRRLSVVAVAAAMLLAIGGFWLVRRMAPRVAPQAVAAHGPATLALAAGHAVLGRKGIDKPAVAGAALAPGDSLRTADQGARLALSSGAQVDVSGVTELRYEAPQAAGWMHESIRLDQGRVDVHVPKLPQGGSFDVVTPDARVEVHGTRFSVSVDRASGGVTTTHVAVTEGRVRVSSRGADTTLGAGDAWTSRPATAPAPATSAAPVAPAPPRPSAAPVAPAPASPPRVAAAPGSTLAQQNRLFQQAMAARRAGDDRRAIALLDQLLARYPGSPLEQDARVERFRALKRLGNGDAASREARRYLAEHPEGFARDEARDMALDPH